MSRNERQKDLIPQNVLEGQLATIVGVGAIGRQIAIQLASIGVPRIQLMDHDKVEEVNLGPQAYFQSDVGKEKVEATKKICEHINPDITIMDIPKKFNKLFFQGGSIFCCVDSIETRKNIFETVKDQTTFFVDGRMSAEFMRIFVIHDKETKDLYPNDLFTSEEAHRGSCTGRSTIYCANVAAGIMVAQYAKWMRGCQLDYNINFNLLTNECIAKTPVLT